MNPLVPMPLDGVLMTASIGALALALVAFVSLIRSTSTVGWRFAAWTIVVFVVPIVGPAAWFVIRRRERLAVAERSRFGS